jgi:sister chromatid cohesion protein DCC1
LVVPFLKGAQATSSSPLKSPKSGLNKSADRSLEADENEVAEDVDLGRIIERREVKKVFHDYYECREIKPRFKKIGDLLQLTKFSGSENEYCVDRKLLFTYDQLLDTAQCSRTEFEDGLRKYRAFEINGYMRILDYEYEYRVITSMLNLLSENSWQLSAVDKEITVDLLEDIYPTEILNGVFDMYTELVPEASGTDTDPKYSYREDMVCRIIAQNILQPGLKFRIDDFLSTWQSALPEGMNIDVSWTWSSLFHSCTHVFVSFRKNISKALELLIVNQPRPVYALCTKRIYQLI